MNLEIEKSKIKLNIAELENDIFVLNEKLDRKKDYLNNAKQKLNFANSKPIRFLKEEEHFLKLQEKFLIKIPTV